MTASRESLRLTHYAPTGPLIAQAVRIADLSTEARQRIRDHAELLSKRARRDTLAEGFALGLVHRFGLDTPQGIALMQLAEALPRTVDTLSAHQLIADKIGALSWRDAISDTPRWSQRLALHALDTLSKAFRNPREDGRFQRYARHTLEKAIAALSSQYVLGQTLAAALRKSKSLARQGYRFSYDVLGEAAMTDAAARAYAQGYCEAIEQLAAHAPRHNGAGRHAISVKLSALHPRFEERQRHRCMPVLLERITHIAKKACAAGLQLTVDAEESERLELTLDVFEHLSALPELADWQGLGIAVQAYQRRALALVDWLGEIAERDRRTINVRLVKGAYWDTEIKRAQQLGLADYPVFVRKCDTDANYLACVRRLLERADCFRAQFATHNAHTIAAIAELANSTGNRQFEYQRLYGMGEHLHDAILREGFVSRIYAPVGPRRELLPYLVRRLLENGASASFVRQLTDATLPIDLLIRDPLAEAQAIDTRRAVVTVPSEIQDQFWSAARGLDLHARDAAAALLTYVSAPQAPTQVAPLIDGEVSAVELQGAAGATTQQSLANPANLEQIVSLVITADAADIDRAVNSAHVASEAWASTPPSSRAQILERAAQAFEQRASQFVRLAVHEAGKTLDDAVAEVREAVDFCRYYAQQCNRAALRTRRPLGVVACISPWNFPLAIFTGQVTASLAIGNTVVAKPAEQTPAIALLAVRTLHEAGVPRNALQLLPGAGEVGAALIARPEIAGVCFTGSVATARIIAQSLAARNAAHLPFIAETGGINAMLVDSSALPEQAVRDVLSSAFQSAGQRCSALRLLCLQEDIADQVLTMLRGALAELNVNDPAHLDSDVGPLIDADACENVRGYLATRTVWAQATLDPQLRERGWFVAPTIIEVERVGDVDREIFGPVLHVLRYQARTTVSLVREINAMGYGLTLGVHSRIRRRVQAVVDAAQVGNVYVNRNQVGAVVGQQPFGGHGLSGTGPKAGGPHYLLRLSKPAMAPPHDRAGRLKLSEHHADGVLTTLLEHARLAQARWQRISRRNETVRFACQLLTANTSHLLSAAVGGIKLPIPQQLTRTLPHVAGEQNVLHLRPRGVVLCISDSRETLDSLAAQIMLSVSAGNSAIAVVCEDVVQAAQELSALLHQCGMPTHLVQCVNLPADGLPINWLTQLHVDAVAFDGDAADRERIAQYLLQRPGALIPLLSAGDDVYRYCVEQTVTTNTAAAGGDPHLLGIAH